MEQHRYRFVLDDIGMEINTQTDYQMSKKTAIKTLMEMALDVMYYTDSIESYDMKGVIYYDNGKEAYRVEGKAKVEIVYVVEDISVIEDVKYYTVDELEDLEVI